MRRKIIVDLFAGGGGASEAIKLATGRDVDIAINHDPAAIRMHAANHPHTLHVCEDVWHARINELVAEKIALLWASPDCKHFSRAKGSVPVSKDIRSLAWVVVRWASQKRPDRIMLENVREFEQWGPLVPRLQCKCGWRGTAGQTIVARKRARCPRCNSLRIVDTGEQMPCPERKGWTFRLFVNRLRGLGYKVDWKTLNAADHGAPTIRKRLFMVARCDGKPIRWPEPSHFDPKKTPLVHGGSSAWRTAAECIDWDIPCPSIFTRKRDLKPATMRRVAFGVKRYVLDNPKPFIVQINNSGTTGRGAYVWPTGEPLRTVTSSNGFALCQPHLMPITHSGDRRSYGMDEPMPTVTTASRGEIALVAPVIAALSHGEGSGGTFGDSRSTDVRQPIGTIHAGGGNHALVAACLSRDFGNSIGQSVDRPAPTATASNHSVLVAAFLAKHFGGMVGVPIDTPLPTTTARGTQNQVVAANLVHLNHGEKQWSGIDDPMRTVTTGKHAALVYSFLTKYFGTAIGQGLDEPLHTITAKPRFGLVIVTIYGEPYVIVHIGMRMLTPRELARAQGFPETYILSGNITNDVARIGNSVSPPPASALVRANWFARKRSFANVG